MIWIIGGTSEAVELANRLAGRMGYIMTAVTESEREFIKDDNVIIHRLSEADMEGFIKENSIGIIVDMSHPYAYEVTDNAKQAAEKCNVKYIRYERGRTEDIEGCIYMHSLSECLEFLKTVKGCVFFTTGSKNIREFESIRGENRFVYRVLPAAASIRECEDNNAKMKDIIASLGPYSAGFNAAMFREYGAQYVVMKDSGRQGGTAEKIEACRKLNIKPVVIGRRDEEGMSSVGDIIRALKQMCG